MCVVVVMCVIGVHGMYARVVAVVGHGVAVDNDMPTLLLLIVVLAAMVLLVLVCVSVV